MKSPARPLFILALLLAFVAAAPRAHAEADNGNPSADFADFVPVDEGEDVYEDETFLYFGKHYGVTVGTGIELFSQAAGQVLDSAIPTVEGRFNFYNDRWSTQLGVQFASHGGNHPDFGPIALKVLRISVDFRYYLSRGNPGASARSGRIEVSSPSPYLGLGLSYFSLILERNNYNEVSSLRSAEWKAPLLGRLPLPIIPSIAGGLDFSLSPRSSVLGLEARWLPLGSYSTDANAVSEIFNGDKLGDIFMFNAYLTFMFD